MLTDYGSRDKKFTDIIREVREKVLHLGGVSKEEGYETILMQGSGTFGIESVISSVIPENGHILVIINGAYGERIAKISERHKIETTRLEFPENEHPSLEVIRRTLDQKTSITHVALIHSETTSGIINPVKEIGIIVNSAGKTFIVDAMSSFGAVPVNIKECKINYLISSANKCIEGVPGFSLVIGEKENLLISKGNARTLSLDLYAQWKGLEDNKQFRFTPPTHTIIAFHQALQELEQEGGIQARCSRYKQNQESLMNGMKLLGFREYLSPDKQGYIITSFLYPENNNFNFSTFYNKLNERGFVIYPGKVSKTDCFRIGSIGQIYPEDINKFLQSVEEVKKEMGF